MSVLTYNGVTLNYLLTHRVEQDSTYDPTDTDQLYTKFTIIVRAVVVAAAGQGTAGPIMATPNAGAAFGAAAFAGLQAANNAGVIAGAANMTPSQIAAQIRHLLNQPRKALTYSVDGTPYIQTTGLDDYKGPMPRHQPIIIPVTSNCFFVDFSIDVWLKDCQGMTGSQSSSFGNIAGVPPYASLRYTQAQDIDHRSYSVIRTVGRLMVRSDMNAIGGPDALRGLVTPPVRAGFFRKSSYTLQADGMALDFNIEDTEQWLMPPAGCVNASGKITVSTTDGAKYFADVYLRLEGSKALTKLQLMQQAAAIAYTKLQQANTISPQVPIDQQQTTAPIIIAGSFGNSLYENVVEISLRAQCNAFGMANKPNAGATTSWSIGAASLIGSAVGSLINVPGLGNAISLANQTANAQAQAANANPASTGTAVNFNGLAITPEQSGSVQSPISLDPGLRGYLTSLKLIAETFNDACLNAQVTVMQSNLSAVAGPTAGPAQSAISSLNTVNAPVQNSPLVTADLSASVVQVASSLGPDPTINSPNAFGDPNPGVWDEFYCEMVYPKSPGMIAMPGTNPAAPVAFVQIHQPYATVKVRWIASKMGGQPAIPPETPADSNLVLIDSVPILPQTELASDGQTLVYKQMGEYTYGVQNIAALNVISPIPPWMNVAQSELASMLIDATITAGTSEPATSTLRGGVNWELDAEPAAVAADVSASELVGAAGVAGPAGIPGPQTPPIPGN